MRKLLVIVLTVIISAGIFSCSSNNSKSKVKDRVAPEVFRIVSVEPNPKSKICIDDEKNRYVKIRFSQAIDPKSFKDKIKVEDPSGDKTIRDLPYEIGFSKDQRLVIVTLNEVPIKSPCEIIITSGIKSQKGLPLIDTEDSKKKVIELRYFSNDPATKISSHMAWINMKEPEFDPEEVKKANARIEVLQALDKLQSDVDKLRTKTSAKAPAKIPEVKPQPIGKYQKNYYDAVDEKIKTKLKLRYAVNAFPLTMTDKDKGYVKSGYIDNRVLKLMIHFSQHGHKLGFRLKDGYDDQKHCLSRETYYQKPGEVNVSAHFNGQAIDIFIADGVEIGWQTGPDPVKRLAAKQKIRHLIKELFDYSLKKSDYSQQITQMLIYSEDDVKYFSQEAEKLYGPKEYRRRNNLMHGSHFWDRIHIGF